MESAPQSTINNNAVIEFASDPDCQFTPCPRKRERPKRRPAPPKGLPQIGRNHAKIDPRVQRREWPKRSISAGIWREQSLFAKILEMAVREALQRYLPAPRVQKAGNRSPGDNRADRGYGDPGALRGLREGVKASLRDRA